MEALQLCNLPPSPGPILPKGLDPAREKSIVLVANKWINGTRLTYYFKDVGPYKWPESQKQVVREAFGTWKGLGIGLDFAETSSSSDAMLLIGLVQGDGSWWWVGTDVLHNRRFGCNMNFGWDLRTDWGQATALHEIGHAMGMPHEHQNPRSGIVWNEAAVIEHFSAPPNEWSVPEIRHNILRHLDPREVEGSSWDPRSIMHYGFGENMIDAPPPYSSQGIAPNYGLSASDQAWASRFYPPVDIANLNSIDVGEAAPLSPTQAGQVDFVFTPTETREYRLRTLGMADRKIAIGRVCPEGSLDFIEVEDDSATEESAQIVSELSAGENYRISARTHFANDGGQNAIVIE